jgi:hypothetical protein
MSPVHDPRIFQAAVAGVGGAGLSIALIVAWRLARRDHADADERKAEA